MSESPRGNYSGLGGRAPSSEAEEPWPIGTKVRRVKLTEQERRKGYRQTGTIKGYNRRHWDGDIRALVAWQRADEAGLDKAKWHRARTLFSTEVKVAGLEEAR